MTGRCDICKEIKNKVKLLKATTPKYTEHNHIFYCKTCFNKEPWSKYYKWEELEEYELIKSEIKKFLENYLLLKWGYEGVEGAFLELTKMEVGMSFYDENKFCVDGFAKHGIMEESSEIVDFGGIFLEKDGSTFKRIEIDGSFESFEI